jgi:hypothetical protein
MPQSFLSPSAYLSLASYRTIGTNEAEQYYYKLKRNPNLIIAHDIETAETPGISEETYTETTSTEITQIQYATDKYNAVIFPRFEGIYAQVACEIATLPNICIGFNCWNFDNPILRNNRAKKVDIQEDKCHDAMWMFHHYQPGLPRGLQAVASFAGFPFPWKHLFGADMELYGGADVCSLHFILEYLPRVMKARGVWNGYMDYVYKFRSKMLYPAQVYGIPVNEEKRIKLDEEFAVLQKSIDDTLQEAVPLELRNLSPRRKVKYHDTDTGKTFEHVEFGYKSDSAAALKKAFAQAREEYDRGTRLLSAASRKPISYESFLAMRYSLVKRRFRDFDINTGRQDITVERWCKFYPFKASFDQLSRYIKWKQSQLAGSTDVNERKIAKLWEVPTNHDGKETTSKAEIELLSEKVGADPVLDNVLDLRSISTNRKNYIPNWRPNPLTDCVHTTFGFSAASGQIDSRKPNVLNVSKHTDYGQMFRGIIEAPEGWEFLEADKKSFHVATCGYRANDASYIRFSQIDPHSIFTSYIMPKEWGKPIDLSLSDDDIRDRCKWIKNKCKEEEKAGRVNIRQRQAKVVVLGNQLGLGYRKLYWQNRKYIKDQNTARGYQLELANLFSKVEQMKTDVTHQAYRQTYLINEFEYIQWFYDVINWTWNKKLNGGKGGWDERAGDGARDAVAFMVQSPAFGMIKDEGTRIEPRIHALTGLPLAFRLSIHDSLIFLYPTKYREGVVKIVLDEMNKSCGKLVNEATGPMGLKVGVEYTIGRNWREYHKDTNPEGMREMVA